MWLDQPRNPRSPLAGLRVLELARVLAGPWAGQILADLGADVIKVESPDGDGTRQWGPPWIERAGETSAAYYHGCNRGKRGMVADFTDAAALEMVKLLAAGADVVIENFRVGSLARFGLDYGALSETNPRLVYCSITGFGQTGPRASEAGYDFVAQGMSGLMALTGEPDGDPMKMGVSISDLSCGTFAVIGIQAALAMRERTGRGQQVDMALLDCSVSLLANQALTLLATGENPPRMGNAHAQVAPYGVFPVADGHVILAPANHGLFGRLMALLGIAEATSDPRFADNAGRVAHRHALDRMIGEASLRWTRADLLEACHKAGVPAGPILPLDAVFADPQVEARGMRLDYGGTPGLRSPFVFSDAELALDRPSPALGEHQPKTA